MESLDRARDLGVTFLVASSLFGLAGVAAVLARPDEGARLLGAAEGIVGFLNVPMLPRDRPIRERCLMALRAALAEEGLAVLREAGRLLTIEQAVAQAQAVADRAE